MQWLISALFDKPTETTGVTPPPVASLTADQRDFLLFALHNGYWYNFNFKRRLADCGLPSTQKTLAEYLGVPAPPERTNPQKRAKR
ncbi:MAG TPA: hypothetical protein VFQ25_09175 [Ktedonobacterales bacterium]|nr:hypothetical protein [Ktedonobacterales bacterium]